MSSHRALVPLLVLLLTACPGNKPLDPEPPKTDGGSHVTDGGHDEPLAITTSGLLPATVNVAYSATLSASGGVSPQAWRVSAGALPSGLSLSAQGEVSGTPSVSGTARFTVEVQDAHGTKAHAELSLEVRAGLAISDAVLADAYLGETYAVRLDATGGVAPLTWVLAQGALPTGITLTTDGQLTGSPITVGPWAFSVGARDAEGKSAAHPFLLTVYSPPAFTTSNLPPAVVGTAYSASVPGTGGKGALSYRLVSGALPDGLRLEGSTLLGTPSTATTATFTLEVSDANGHTATAAFGLDVRGVVTLTSTVLPDGYTDATYRQPLSAAGGRSPYRWVLVSGSLPSGLSLVETGSLEGTPTAAGTSSFVLRVTDADGFSDARSVSVSMYRPPSITTATTLPDAYSSEPYAHVVTAVDGKAPRTFTVAGALPSGLTLSSEGSLSGTPSTTGSGFSLAITVTDANGRTASRTVALSVYAPPDVTSASLPIALIGQPYSATLTASGGKAGLSWAVTSGGLPMGLSLSSSGVLSGTPTGDAATFSATFTITDANGHVASRSLTLTLSSPLLVTTSTLPDATVGQAYSATLAASGGRLPLTWSFSGALPVGLSLSSDGVLSGTPSVQGQASFLAIVRDANNLSDSRTLSLAVKAPAVPFTVAHWNLEWFGAPNQGPPHSTSDGGLTDDLQIAYARDVIRDAGVNVWGLVEMVDTADFDTLKAQLPGYRGFLANNTAFVSSGASSYSVGEQKPGILYDDSVTFQSAQVILTTKAADFGGRPPLRVNFTTAMHGTTANLVVIVVHMKAFDDLVSYGQRQRAGAALKTYLDTELSTERVLVMGDWNDDVDQSISKDDLGAILPSPYQPLVDDSAHYIFITQALSLAGDRTTVSYRDVIDHTMVTDEVAVDYVPGSVVVLRPDAWLPDYGNTVSDHYPVQSRYDFRSTGGPTLRLLSPQGGTYLAGSTVSIAWRSTGIATLRLEFSLDNGEHWQVIAPTVSAALGSYPWTLPDSVSNTVRVRVVDTSNVSNAATHDTPLVLTRDQPHMFINEVLANEPSFDGGTGDTAYEFVELVNAGPVSADLSGWTLWDSLSTRHVFAAGTTVAPGRAFVIYGGASAFPPGTPNTVAASVGGLALNNSSDSVRLKRPDAGIEDEMSYTSTVDNVSVNRSPDATLDAGFVLHNVLSPGRTSSAGLRADGGVF
ncbi:putative Ig domain-containing protein [Myxococcaceae bacterium JPH2]|nr:putative Ig domain-containing protein [Myxococcaceae bacterium JPH2]